MAILAIFASPTTRSAWAADVLKIEANDRAAIQAAIDHAGAVGERQVVIPPGVYRLTRGKGNAYFSFHHLSDLQIIAEGVTFLRTDPALGGLEFADCRGITLRGLTLINQTPPFTQGKITAIDPAGFWWDLRLADGYPPLYKPSEQAAGYVFDPLTRQWKANTHDVSVDRAESIGERNYRLHFKNSQAAADQNAAVGDLMAFRGMGTTDIFLGNCAQMTIVDVTIRSGGGFCIHEADGDGGSHYTYTVTYGPRPPGATEDPLIACNADAFHSSTVRRGPTLEDCRFEGMPDDGIAIHGSYELVTDAGEKALTVCRRGQGFRPGDFIRLFGQKDGGFLGEAKIVAAETLRNYVPPSPITNDRFKDSHDFDRLTLDRHLAGSAGSLASDPAENGSGYVIRRCTLRNHRARGMLLKADDGLVEGNIVDGSTMAGIVLSPELYWNEACFSRNVIVRGNTIRHVGYQNAGSWMGQAGAITVRGDDEPVDRPANFEPGHRDIRIESNTIENCDGLQILVSDARGVLVAGNKFVNPERHACTRGAGRGVDPLALIQLGPGKDIEVRDNTFTGRGEFGKKTVVSADPANAARVAAGVRQEP